MAGKYDPDAARRSVSVPFASGLQDARLGLAENVMLYTTKDVFNGEFKYFTSRPNIITGDQQVEGVSTSIGSPYDVSQYDPNRGTYLVLATSSNVFFTTPGGGSNVATPVLTGADKTAYQTSVASYRPRIIQYQNVATTANSFLCVADVLASKLYDIHSSGTYTAISLGFSPSPYGVAMDGYVFLSVLNGDTIYNCDLNTIGTWNLGVNNIRATQYTGSIQALARQNNMILAFKDNSIEYFYNAGLANTSPLQRQTSYTKQVGLSYTGSLAQWDNDFFFMGQSNGHAENAIYHLTSSALTNISTPAVDRIIAAALNSSPNTSSISSMCLKVGSKTLYLLSSYGVSFARDFTLVYDVEEEQWYQWRTQLGNVTNVFPITCGTTFSNIGMVYYLDGDKMDTFSASFEAYLGLSDGTFGPSSTKDLDNVGGYLPITMVMKIPSFDFGSGNRKILHEMSLAVNTPDTMLHTLDFYKVVGGERQTVSQYTTNGNNMNLKNWGSFVSGYAIYTLEDPSSDTVPGLDASDLRINSVNMEVSLGIS